MLLDIQRPDTFVRFMRDTEASENELLRQKIERFTDSVKNILMSKKEIYPQITHEIFEALFNIRVEVFPEVSNNENFYSGKMRDIFFQEILSYEYPDMEILAENIAFAFRCLKKVEKALLPQIQNVIEMQKNEGIELEIPNYSEMVNSLLAVSHDKNSILTIRFINTTLYIEFVIIAFYLITEKKITVSINTIDELSQIIANSSHGYMAYAIELGLLNFNSSDNIAKPKVKLNNDFIQEQKELAEVGFTDWVKNLDK